MTAVRRAVRLEAKPLGTIADRPVHGAAADPVFPARSPLNNAKIVIGRALKYIYRSRYVISKHCNCSLPQSETINREKQNVRIVGTAAPIQHNGGATNRGANPILCSLRSVIPVGIARLALRLILR